MEREGKCLDVRSPEYRLGLRIGGGPPLSLGYFDWPVEAVADQVTFSNQIRTLTGVDEEIEGDELPLFSAEMGLRIDLKGFAGEVDPLLYAGFRGGIPPAHRPHVGGYEELAQVRIRRVEFLAFQAERLLASEFVTHQRNRFVRAAAAIEPHGDVIGECERRFGIPRQHCHLFAGQPLAFRGYRSWITSCTIAKRNDAASGVGAT